MSQPIYVWLIAGCTALCVCAFIVQAWATISMLVVLRPSWKAYVDAGSSVTRTVHKSQKLFLEAKPQIVTTSGELRVLLEMTGQQISEAKTELKRVISSAQRMRSKIKQLPFFERHRH